MLAIIMREFEDRKWSLLAYSLGSLALLWIYVATFNVSQASNQQLQELIKSYPKALLEAIGYSSTSMNTLESYLNLKHFSLIWPLLAIVLALSRAGNQIAGEVQSGTMGLLLSLPMTRLRIFTAKYLSGLLTIGVFTVLSVFTVVPLASAYNIPSHPHVLLVAWVLTALFMWVVYSVGLAVSALTSDKARVYAVVGGLIFLSYAANILAAVSDKLSGLKYYSLFYYFTTQDVLSGGGISGRTLLVYGLTIVATTAFAAWWFNRRDVSV